MADLLLLLPSSLLFLCSLLTIFAAPTYRTWKLAIAVTEFPHLFIFLNCLAYLLTRLSAYANIGLIISILSMLLFCYPIFSAMFLSLKVKMLFPKGARSPFNFFKLFSGLGHKKIFPQVHTYKEFSGKKLQLEFYPAISDKKAPCIIVVHGGGWDSGDNHQIAGINSFFATKGYAVAAINYRLAPDHICPAPVEDILDALAFLKSNTEELNIDVSKFALLGRSAGGQIALLAAYSKQLPEIKGVISFYAPADMVWGWSIPGNPLVLDSRYTMKRFLGGTYDEVPDKFFASSPIEFVSMNSVPTLLIHGNNECMVAHEHSVRLREKLHANGVKNFLVTLPWATHGCDFNSRGPSGQISAYAAEEFLREIMK